MLLNQRKYQRWSKDNQKIIRVTSPKLIGARIITKRWVITEFIVMTAMTVRMMWTVKTVNQVEGRRTKEHNRNDGKDGELTTNRLERNSPTELYYSCGHTNRLFDYF